MSLVGPRPIVSAEISKYGAEFDVFLRVLPGLTGLWQVSGRNNTTYQERVQLDSYYANNWSPWLDLFILSRTLRAVMSGRGAC
jgi:lipopolysaccharide/colanic/teichoic acid biosynthesis glycosyltransferase